MTKSQKMLLGLVIIVILIGIGSVMYLNYASFFEPLNRPPLAPSIEPPTPDNCSHLETQIKDLIDQANYCDNDSDCTFGGTEFILCPFGCYVLVNKDVDLNEIERGVKQYSEDCGGCVYECPYDPAPDDIKCINNKCTDIRFNESLPYKLNE